MNETANLASPATLNNVELLSQPITLPNGQVIKNRLAKSAMSEALATIDNRPTPLLDKLYKRWSAGGTGLLITGNIMVDRKALGEPNNVALENDRDMAALRRWVEAGSANNTQLWVQLNHPGKQVPKGLNSRALGPSAVPFDKKMQSFFETPQELTEEEIRDIIKRFATSASLAEEAGFSGAQIHGAHGYLVSQFLSPHHNRREDQWGGSLENRMRFVKEIYRAIRERTGSDFAVSIKMNSADFQKGGFTEEESLTVMKELSGLGIDLIEVSGGTYEAPAMSGAERYKSKAKESTLKREAYFLSFAEKVRGEVSVPLMVTGGFRSQQGMADALRTGAMDLVGLARPLALDPEFSANLLTEGEVESPVKQIKTGIKMIDDMGMMDVAWYARQIKRLAQGKNINLKENPLLALIKILASNGVQIFRNRRVRA